MTTAQELITSIQQATEGTPFVVTPTPKGFRLEHNFVDFKWANIMGTGKMSETFSIDVDLDEQKQSTTWTDNSRSVSWSAGPDGNLMPQFSASASAFRGKSVQFSFGAAAAPTMQGGIDGQSWNFSSNEMKQWLTEQLERNGWTKEKDTFFGVMKRAFGG